MAQSSAKRRRAPDKMVSIDVVTILNAPVTVSVGDGGARSLPVLEVAMRKMLQKALNKGDHRAIADFIKICERHKLLAPRPVAKGDGGVIYAAFGNHEDWDEFRAKLGMYDHPPPWPGEPPDRWKNILRAPPEVHS